MLLLLQILQGTGHSVAPDIQDAMELRALGPNAELVKTISVRDSQCIRIVTPDDHVECGFHEILLHEMREEESPFVATSELDYLRGDWSQVLLALMTRYRQTLERKRKDCNERFGCTQSGNCKHCARYVLTVLESTFPFATWSCLVIWCTMWRWTTWDCREYIRRMHQTPSSVKPANLAKFFLAWTITREQWADLLLPSISGLAVDTLFFSRMASPLGHCYWLISRTGSQYDAVFSVDDFPVVFGARDIRQVVWRRASPPGGQTVGAAHDDRQHEPPAPVVDLVTGKCKRGKVSRPVSTSPPTLDLTVMCTPGVKILLPGASTQVVLPPEGL